MMLPITDTEQSDETDGPVTFTLTIPAENWNQIMAWMNEPPRDVPALRKLMATKPVWLD